jgi:hypothetical protein
MKTLREATQEYLALRRSLGFKLKQHQRFLEEFISFPEEENASGITSPKAQSRLFGDREVSTSAVALPQTARRPFSFRLRMKRSSIGRTTENGSEPKAPISPD